MKILIVDDSEDSRIILKKTLESSGYTVEDASNGQDALQIARQRTPDMIISDILMPGMDGFRICREIKRDYQLRKIPFVFYTANYVAPEDERLGLSLGASRFIIKPVEINKFLKIIEEVLQEYKDKKLPVPESPHIENSELSRMYDERLGIKIDETLEELKRERSSLFESEERFRSVVDNIGIGIYMVNRNMEILLVNNQLKNWFPNVDLSQKKPCYKILQKYFGHLTLSNCPIYRTFNDGKVHETEQEQTLGEERKYYRIISSPVKDDRGNIIAAIQMIEDITAHKRAEEQLKHDYHIQNAINSILRISLETISFEEQLERILDLLISLPWLALQSKGCIYLIEKDPNILIMKVQRGLSESHRRNCSQVHVNKSICGRAFSGREPIFTHTIDECQEYSHGNVSEHGYYCVPILTGDKTFGVITLYVEKGHTREQKEISFLSAVAKILAGIIERKQLENQLYLSQKLEAVGLLAGGVAHDFNNLLTLIFGYSDLLLIKFGLNEELSTKIKEIKKAGEKAASLIRQLMVFSRKQMLQPTIIDLNSVVTDMKKMLKRIISENIELTSLLAPDLGNIKIDPGQLEQVIMNLVVNARDAMPKGGKLTIETANVEFTKDNTYKYIDLKPGHYVMLAISDSGCGMDDKIQSQIFEPFFTTKEHGKGSGLGLSTVYGIIKQNGGHIIVYSEPDQGTTFKIYLPRIYKKGISITPQQTIDMFPRGSETILVVEDDSTLREMVSHMLIESGYTVLKAGNGEEAMRICKKHQKPIHLMITDVIMPGMSIIELVKRISSLHPETKVLYTSGYTDNAVVRHGLLEKPEGAFLQKPFSSFTLLCKVRKILYTPKNGIDEDAGPGKS
jgi:signal transduction histidine kinase/DNA-binding response OmpR family regulator